MTREHVRGGHPSHWLAGVGLCAVILLIITEILSPWRVQIRAQDPDMPGNIVRASRTRPQQSLAIISEHPLFVPSRRPWTPVPRSAPPAVSSRPVSPPAQLNGYDLRGVTISPRGRFALIWSQVGRANIRLVPKQSLDGWTLVTIDMNGLEFVEGGRTLRMAFPGAPGGPSGIRQAAPGAQSPLRLTGSSAR